MTPALLKRGCVNVIGLDTIKARIGERWERTREHVYARLEALLQSKLGPTDFFMRITDVAYLVTTPSFENGEAALCCLKVAQELHIGLLGRCAMADISLSRMTGDKPDAVGLAKIEGPDLATLAREAGMEDPEIAAVLGDPSARKGETKSAPEDEADTVFAIPTPRAASVEKKPRFSPIWDLRKYAITSYRFNVAPPRFSEYETPIELRAQISKFMNWLRYAATVMVSSIDNDVRFLTVIPVHFEILSAPVGRMELTAVCRNLPAELRPLLMFEVFDVPAGVPQSRMNELVGAIRPFCRGASLSYAPGFFEYPDYPVTGLQAVGFQTPHGTPPRLLRERIGKLTDVARRQGVVSFLSGVRSLGTAGLARAEGVDLLVGSAIGGEVDVPSGMSRLTWDAFLQQQPHTVAV